MLSFVTLLKGIRRLNSKRVLRGGSWINNARNLRSANRNANTPDNRNHNIGLRLAGALLPAFYIVKDIGGSINQSIFQFETVDSTTFQQNQDPQRVSRYVSQSLLMGRLYSSGAGYEY